MLHLQKPLAEIPPDIFGAANLALANEGKDLVFTYDTQGERTGVTRLLTDLNRLDIRLRDLQTKQSSLEEIFIGLVKENERAAAGARS